MSVNHVDADRLFPIDPTQRQLAQEIYQTAVGLPILAQVSQMPENLLSNQKYIDFAELLLPVQSELSQLLAGHGIRLQQLEKAISDRDPVGVLQDWQTLVAHRHLFQGLSEDLHLKYILQHVFPVNLPFNAESARAIAEQINQRLQTADYLPQALCQRQKIESLIVSHSGVADLSAFSASTATQSGVKLRPSFRPDALLDPENPEFNASLDRLAELTAEDTQTYLGYLKALVKRRQHFKSQGATISEHHHPSAASVELTHGFAAQLFLKARQERCTASEAEAFRAHMLFEMARMSLDDGLVMQLHVGFFRNHNTLMPAQSGFQTGADIPIQTEYSRSLWAILNAFGHEPAFKLVIVSQNEAAYGQQLAPLARIYKALKIATPWRFQRSPEGLKRFHQGVSAQAGFYNTVNLGGAHHSFAYIAADWDLNRRADASFLANWVSQQRLDLAEAQQIAQDLAYYLPKKVYGL